MKTKIQFRKDANVSAVTNKQVGVDSRILNPVSNVINNVLIRMANFFKKDEKLLPVDMSHPNKLPVNAEYDESDLALIPTAGETLATQTPPNVADEAARNENVKVISADGMHVGNVQRMFTESTFDQITHLLISKEKPAMERKLIPIKWVQTMGDEAVHLCVTKDSVAELADASIIW